MYTQSITRTHRTAIILAIDGSGSMAEKIRFRNRQMTKAEAVATITNGMLFELIERARRSHGVRDCCRNCCCAPRAKAKCATTTTSP